MYKSIDLRGTPCPVNFVRCRLEVEQLSYKETLQVDIDRGEPEEMVLPGLKKAGYEVKIILKESNWIRFLVFSNAR